jgi:hypothetical protein
MSIEDLAADLSTAGFAEGFSEPFGGWVGPREADGVDLSGGVAVDSVDFFLSPADCGGTGVEGRGEGARPFCCDWESACINFPMFRWFSPWKPHSQEPRDVPAS